MIVVRNVFNLKFGKAKEAKALVEEQKKMLKKYNYAEPRFLTDVTGPFYVIEMEITAADLAQYEKQSLDMMKAPEFGEWYQRFIPLVDSGSRQIYTVVQ